MMGDQISHLIKQHVADALSGYEADHIYGHIASYDPALHRVRVVIPSRRDDDGNPVLTPWMPLGTMGLGQNGGVQYHPFAGATQENPTAGEQCIVSVLDRQRGTVVASCLFFNGGDLPPSQSLPTSKPSQPGEYLIRHTSGSLIRLHANGDVEVNAAGKLIANSVGDATVHAQGQATVQSDQQANITAPAINVGSSGEGLHKLVTDAFMVVFNGHVHGNSGGPSPQMTTADLTSVLSAG